MIARMTADQLRKMAGLVEAYTRLEDAGGPHQSANTTLQIEGQPMAYLIWWEDGQQYVAEFISFTPKGAEPLCWHDELDPIPQS